jgi:hypothetical protein
MKKIIVSFFMLSTIASFAGTCKSRNNPAYSELCIQHEESIQLQDRVVTCGLQKNTAKLEEAMFQLDSNAAIGVQTNTIRGLEGASDNSMTLIICASKN